MKKENIKIRVTDSSDINDILEVEQKAFNRDDVVKLTDDLLKDESAEPILSLLAFYKEEAVGHILFTKASIENVKDQPLMHILAPLAIKPEFQKMGIGGKLISDGLERLKKMGSELVFVLGHIDYYPRHGFIPDAKKLGYPAPYPIPDEFADAWMVQSLTSNGLAGVAGNVTCAKAMDEPEHWRE